MKPKLDLLGTLCGVLGAAICLLAFVLRIIGRGEPDFMTMAPQNIFLGGIAFMVFGCWAKLTAR